jgi:hypothetical protein
LPASGWEMMAKVLLLLISSANEPLAMILKLSSSTTIVSACAL